MADGPTEVVENGEEGPGGILGCVAGAVGELLGLAAAKVLEVCGQTEELVVPLLELAPQALDLLLRSGGGRSLLRHRSVRGRWARRSLGITSGGTRGAGITPSGRPLAFRGTDGSPVGVPPGVLAHPRPPLSRAMVD